jgi:hypothetical protein
MTISNNRRILPTGDTMEKAKPVWTSRLPVRVAFIVTILVIASFVLAVAFFLGVSSGKYVTAVEGSYSFIFRKESK